MIYFVSDIRSRRNRGSRFVWAFPLSGVSYAVQSAYDTFHPFRINTIEFRKEPNSSTSVLLY
jgi:hypothetical protein